MNFFGVKVRSFNIEITNNCVLACSECPRTRNPWVEGNITDLPVSVFEKIFPLIERDNFTGLRANLCGAHGDCAYHRQFHDVIAYLKKAGLTIGIETNGSHRKADWWERTCDLLSEDDYITFSVDGLEDTNHIYRENARWPDIERAMRVCAPRVHVGWKYLVFKHNEHQIDAAKALADDIGVHDMTFKMSGRFSDDDPLAPDNDDYIGVVTRNRRSIQALIDAGVDDETFDDSVAIRPKCYSGKNLAITASGYLYPCTSCETSATDTWFYENREHFNLRTHRVAEILASSKWRELEANWARASQAPRECLYYCGVHHNYDEGYDLGSPEDRPNKPTDGVLLNFA